MANSIVDVLSRRAERAERQERHEKWHPKPPEKPKCETCGQEFAAKYQLQIHVQSFTVDGQQICNLSNAEQLRIRRG